MRTTVEFDVRVFEDVPKDASDDADAVEIKVAEVDLDGGTLWVYVTLPEPLRRG